MVASGFIFGHGLNYFLNGNMNIPLLIGFILIFNTMALPHMRNYWKDLFIGERTTYSDTKLGFTNEILDKTTKLNSANDLIEALQQATKKKPKDISGLKGNPLDD